MVFASIIYQCVFVDAMISMNCSLLYCKKKDQIDISSKCKTTSSLGKLKCAEYFNQIQILLKYEDEFNFLYSVSGEDVVYSANNKIYSTTCTTIKQIYIPQSVDHCTKDLPVVVNNIEIVFLTREGILRSDTMNVTCSGQDHFFKIGQQEFVKNNQNINLISKADKLTSLFDIDNAETQIQYLLNSYYEYIHTNKTLIVFEDLAIVFVLILLMRYKIGTIKEKCESMFKTQNTTLDENTNTIENDDIKVEVTDA